MALGELGAILTVLAIIAVLLWLIGKARSSGSDTFAVPDRPDIQYEVFTTEFDIECDSEEVNAVLLRSGNNIQATRGLRGRNAAHVQSVFDQSLSVCSDRLRRREPRSLKGSSFLILLDQSGSMAERMPQLAGELCAAIEWLEQMDATVMLAGFTTVGWHGGKSRKKWLKHGRPAYPGRLCDLMYITYSRFEYFTTAPEVAALIESRAFFENVDGEALLWARQQLANATEEKRSMIVLSDGAPVDDSTLFANGNEFLWRHFTSVVKEVEEDDSLKLGAIGLDHRVDTVYETARMVSEGASLAQTLLDLAEELSRQGI